MKDKKELAKMALAGILLASTLPAGVQAEEIHSTGILLAVAGCPAHGCGGNKPSPTPAKTGQLADAAGDLSVPRSSASQGGGYGNATPSSPSSVGGSYGSSYGGVTTYDTGPSAAYRMNSGGGYGVPENRPGSSSDAGSWSGTGRPADLGRSRVQDYNVNAYNTNRNFNTSPTYEGQYLDSSYYSDTVAPYGAPKTSYGSGPGYQGGAGYGYGYEGVATSGIMSEAQLLTLLSPQGKDLYAKLDPEGKALALQLASQANFSNKDLAVKEATARMQERRSYMQRYK